MRSKKRHQRPKIFSRARQLRSSKFSNNDLLIDDQEELIERPRNKAIYLLPNAFTTGALFFGFFAIVQAMNQHWETASMAIFCSLILDGMDGRVARMTHTQSAFGEQYDSLADMVSFGVAPALVAYEWALKGLGKWGWVAAFIYCAGAALRLARFNISTGILGVFTNKFLFSFSSFKELLILRKYLKNNNVDNYLLEQNKRNLLLKIFTGYNFKYIFRQKNIYDNYISFFKSINTTHIVHLISNNSKVLIFPDSRKIEKKINSKTLFNLIDILEAKRIDYTIANYKT